jgi:hypothetical protein
MIHWLGDRYGYISAPAVANYAKEMAGFDMLTGLYSDSGGKATLTISANLQLAAQKAMEGSLKTTTLADIAEDTKQAVGNESNEKRLIVK